MLKFVKSISLFFVIAILVILTVFVMTRRKTEEHEGNDPVSLNTEQVDTDPEEDGNNREADEPSLSVIPARYRMILADDRLVVYLLPDAEEYMSISIDRDAVSGEEKYLLENGIEFSDDEELFDYLESITS